MTKNVVVDDALIAEAMRVGGHKTKREAATAALESYIKTKLRADGLDMIDKIDFGSKRDSQGPRRRGKD